MLSRYGFLPIDHVPKLLRGFCLCWLYRFVYFFVCVVYQCLLNVLSFLFGLRRSKGLRYIGQCHQLVSLQLPGKRSSISDFTIALYLALFVLTLLSSYMLSDSIIFMYLLLMKSSISCSLSFKSFSAIFLTNSIETVNQLCYCWL